ncbi:hypothetical protein I7I51_03312 [Histoplasma capsulatum]|uniref:Uncharacterized protein n=1 Tax=Ajellomyces capsulatus TaxID=5037 RepID=A0A8A1M782_AJECA|nr:hypothetical protein I7I51_03312 [Histoplasma capsulatum]
MLQTLREDNRKRLVKRAQDHGESIVRLKDKVNSGRDPKALKQGLPSLVNLVYIDRGEHVKKSPAKETNHKNSSSEEFLTAESKSLQSRAAEPAQLVFQRYHAHQTPREDEAPCNDDNDSKQPAGLPDRPRARASGVQWPTLTPHRCQGADEQQASSTHSRVMSCHVMSCHVMGDGAFADWTIERPGSQRVGGEKQASKQAMTLDLQLASARLGDGAV